MEENFIHIILPSYDYLFWQKVFVNIFVMLVFAVSFIRPKGKVEWKSFEMFTAFIIALFIEMFGIPLTIFILVSIMGEYYPSLDPFSHSAGHLLLTFFGIEHSSTAFATIHYMSNGIVFLGMIVIAVGWWKIFRASRKESLATDGIYRYIRHPQYLGIYLIITGFLIQWPTIVTLAMAPVLFVTYYRLAMREEKEMEGTFGNEWEAYRKATPLFCRGYGWEKSTPINMKRNCHAVLYSYFLSRTDRR